MLPPIKRKEKKKEKNPKPRNSLTRKDDYCCIICNGEKKIKIS